MYFVIRLLSLATIFGILAGFIVLIFMSNQYGDIIKSYYNDAVRVVDESTPDTFHLSETSYVYAADGSVLCKLRQNADCKYVEYNELPADVIDAFVSVEDRRFYEHSGIDFMSTAKAIFLLFRDSEISRGGSTITQQLARNVFLNFEKSYERKLREIFIAWELEKKYSKQQILEFYINNINYGNGYYGIGAAANGYFNKDIHKLSCEQIALLCAIPNNPTYYNPRTNLQHTVSRRNLILKRMYDQDRLEEDEYLAFVNTPVKLAVSKTPFHNYEGSYAIKCSIEYLMKLSGFVFEYAWNDMSAYWEYQERYDTQYDLCRTMLYTGGYSIKTSMNLTVQRKLQKVLDSVLSSFEEKSADGVYVMQGACVVISNKTGNVISSVGGRTQDDLGAIYSLNRAYQSYKQPGSTIKPLIVYTPALENGYTPDSSVVDEYFEGGPRNSDGVYCGDITLRSAVEQSKNVVAWKLFNERSSQIGISYVQKMHFSKITPNDYYPSASLGGLYYGVTVEEMASGYSTIENDGVFREPTCIISFKDKEGNELYKKPKSIRVYEKNASRMMTDILCGVADVGTAHGLTIESNPDMPVACKTGTTNNQTCGWFCGFTPYYTCAVYVGADTPKFADGLFGASYPKDIWSGIQTYLNKGKKVKTFKSFILKNTEKTGYDTVKTESESLHSKKNETPSTVSPSMSASVTQKEILNCSDISQSENNKDETIELTESESILDDFVSNESVLDDSVLDESALNDSILDDSVLDDSVLDESVLDEPVLDDSLYLEEQDIPDEGVIDNPATEKSPEQNLSEESVSGEISSDSMSEPDPL